MDKNILLVGETTVLEDSILTVLQEIKIKYNLIHAQNSEKALNLLRAGYQQKKRYDLIILTKNCGNPYELGFVANVLRNKHACGKVILISDTPDWYKIAHLGMTSVSDISDLISCIKELYQAPKNSLNLGTIRENKKESDKQNNNFSC